jgi:hypothetical protein
MALDCRVRKHGLLRFEHERRLRDREGTAFPDAALQRPARDATDRAEGRSRLTLYVQRTIVRQVNAATRGT